MIIIDRIKKLRKEFEKWLKIPQIIRANRIYIRELNYATDKIEELRNTIETLQTEILFYEQKYNKINDKYINLKSEINKKE